MTRATLLYYAQTLDDDMSVKRLIDYLSDRAVAYGLIESDEKILCEDISGICDLIYQSNNRIVEYSGQQLI